MTAGQARRLGYEIQRWRGAFHCTPIPVHPDTCYGRAFATEAAACEEVERRLAHRLGVPIPLLREHLAAVTHLEVAP